MPARACVLRGPGCSDGGVAIPGSSRCPAHTRAGWARKSPAMAARSSFYRSANWKQRAARQLREFPNCAVCGAPATQADHITEMGLGGDPDGPLQSLCSEHHRIKTARAGGVAAKEARRRRGE